MIIEVGTIVGGRYEIQEKIGSGGMAEVFRGKDHKLNRFVAVKVLKEEFRENDGFIKKFKKEAQAAAALAHPNIVNVYDVGDESGIYYIVMELVEGITLKDYIERKGHLTVKEATSIAIQVSAGMEVAHNNQIVHRDIKPQNIIISRAGKVKVTDFGIAKATTSQTTVSTTMGSVHYASPEQARGGYVDHRSDIYSLGIVLYEMVTGRVPFDGDTAVTIAVKHLQDAVVPPSNYNSGIPYSLEQIIKKCVEKSPDRRYQDIEDLLADLKQSLMNPDGDFVQMVNLNTRGQTMVMNKKSLSKARATRKMELDKEDEEEEEGEEGEDEDSDEELSPTVEKIMTVAGIALAVLIVIILLLLVSRVLGLGGKKDADPKEDSQQKTEETEDKEDETPSEKPTDANTVAMPSLLGKTMAQAKAELEDLGLAIRVKGSESSSEYAAGEIMWQGVGSGERVDVGSTVEVMVASSDSGSGVGTGPEPADSGTTSKEDAVFVPKVTGQTESIARSALEAAGLKVGSVSEENSDAVADGSVISQDPPARASVKKGSAVKLVISKGSAKVKVIDVVGHEQNRATGELQSAGFAVNSKAEYNELSAGLVIRTQPETGSMVAPGSTVTIIVSQGIEQIKVPSVSVNMDFKAAEAALRNAGFRGTVSEKKETSSSVGAGYVTRYEPSGKVAPDGAIAIWVSSGPPAPAPAPTPAPDATQGASP